MKFLKNHTKNIWSLKMKLKKTYESVNKKTGYREIKFFCDITKTWQTLEIKKL